MLVYGSFFWCCLVRYIPQEVCSAEGSLCFGKGRIGMGEEQKVQGSGPSGGKKRRGRRSSRKYKSRKPSKQFEPIICAVCGKPIDGISQAIGGPGEQEVSHFECILNSIAEEEQLSPGQKISYIGNGTFAVLEYEKKNFSGKFSIVKRIQIESKETTDRIKRVVDERKHAVDLTRRR